MSTEQKPPAAADVDAVAKEMIHLKVEVDRINASATKEILPLAKRAGELREQALTWLKEFGSAHAEKSKLLHGVLYEIMGTFGSSTSIDAAAVEAFRLGLVKAGKSRMLKLVFEKSVRWSLRPEFAAVIKGTRLPEKLLALYSQCQVTKEKTPAIMPRMKQKIA
jgi:hypothetical protein